MKYKIIKVPENFHQLGGRARWKNSTPEERKAAGQRLLEARKQAREKRGLIEKRELTKEQKLMEDLRACPTMEARERVLKEAGLSIARNNYERKD